jgi:hypothetical protein
MGEVLRERECEVQQAPIEFTDSRYAKRFSQFPFRHLYRDLFGMIPAQLRGATGEIRIPDLARDWGINLRTVKKLGTAWGGEYFDGAHWAFAGGQIKSLLSLLSYLGKGENREKYLGVKIPATNLQPDDLEQARTFASKLADRLAAGHAA